MDPSEATVTERIGTPSSGTFLDFSCQDSLSSTTTRHTGILASACVQACAAKSQILTAPF